MGGRIYITAWLRGVSVGDWYFSLDEAEKAQLLIESIQRKATQGECDVITRRETFESEPFYDGKHDYQVKEVWKETITLFRQKDGFWRTFKASDLLEEGLKDLKERP